MLIQSLKHGSNLEYETFHIILLDDMFYNLSLRNNYKNSLFK